jgi:hypothetical protein
MIITISFVVLAIIGLVIAYRRLKEANTKFDAAQIILQESDDMRDAMMFSVSEATVLADQMTAAMTVTRELDEANTAAMTVTRELDEAKSIIALAKEKARIIAERLARVTGK